MSTANKLFIAIHSLCLNHSLSLSYDFHSFDRAGFSLTETKEVLSSIASDCMVDDGDCLNAVEIFWSPSERDEVMNRLDMITDFPELIDI